MRQILQLLRLALAVAITASIASAMGLIASYLVAMGPGLVYGTDVLMWWFWFGLPLGILIGILVFCFVAKRIAPPISALFRR